MYNSLPDLVPNGDAGEKTTLAPATEPLRDRIPGLLEQTRFEAAHQRAKTPVRFQNLNVRQPVELRYVQDQNR